MNIKRLNRVLCLGVLCVVSSVTVAKDLAMTENNIQECSKLLNKVAQTDEAILKNMQARQTKAAQNAAIFAAHNSAQPFPLTEKPIVQAMATPAKPATYTETTSLPANTQLFASDDPREIDHLTGKNTKPLMSTPDYSAPKTAAKPLKTSAAKPKANKKQPHIKLFAPNESTDLNHLEGKSASINELNKSKKTDSNKTMSESEKISDVVIKSSI